MQLSDDKRFQNLPPEDIREIIRNTVTAEGWKYIFIEHTSWYNLKTRCKHDITNMPIVAIANTSNRPIAVTDVEVFKQKETDEESYDRVGRWCYNADYVHQNITSEISHKVTRCHDGYKVSIEGHAICNPITEGHFFQRQLEEIKPLFIGQLMGQNGGSPFRTVSSVAGTYHYNVINTTNGGFITRTAPIVQLLTRCPSDVLQNKTRLITAIRDARFPKDNEVAFKDITNDKYYIGTQEELEECKKKNSLSAYYPIITAEMCKNLLDNLPRIDVDFGCFGLGSAGSGVLDMLSRSIFFEKYMLVDFDRVESKNIRNQWYETNQINQSKVQASDYHLKYRNIAYSYKEIIPKNCKFEDIDFRIYKFKYVMAAFDKIQTRLDFLDKMLEEKTQCKFLFDARYDDLTASVFFIDLENKDEVEYYKQGLLSDLEAFKKQEANRVVDSWEKFQKWLESQGTFSTNCGGTKRILERLGINRTWLVCPRTSEGLWDDNHRCGGDECMKVMKDMYEHYKELIAKQLLLPEEESSCVRQNFIDIYHYASTYIFDAIRAMEAENPKKLFTHIDVTTDPLPNSMILRK